MRGVVLVGLLASAGCRSVFGLDDPQLAQPDARVVDAFVPLDGSMSCYGTFVNVCFQGKPQDSVSLVGTVNTDTDPRCAVRTQVDGTSLCVIAGTQIDVADVTATGSRALVLVASDTLTVAGVLDASSKLGVRTGPAASTSVCASPAGDSNTTGSGGGAGGSFGSAGGSGGAGSSGAVGGVAPGGTSRPSVLRAGCAGGAAGTADGIGSGGVAGAGGGALALIAAKSISVPGSIFASGAGGGPGNPNEAAQNRGGGGGGGAGGLIVLDAPLLDVSGTIAANGGGGGGGGDCCSGNAGGDGSTTPLTYNVPASGGAQEGASHGGPGGPGAAGSTSAQSGMAPSGGGGGGGGGGGVGFVLVRGTVMGTRISPAPTSLP